MKPQRHIPILLLVAFLAAFGCIPDMVAQKETVQGSMDSPKKVLTALLQMQGH